MPPSQCRNSADFFSAIRKQLRSIFCSSVFLILYQYILPFFYYHTRHFCLPPLAIFVYPPSPFLACGKRTEKACFLSGSANCRYPFCPYFLLSLSTNESKGISALRTSSTKESKGICFTNVFVRAKTVRYACGDACIMLPLPWRFSAKRRSRKRSCRKVGKTSRLAERSNRTRQGQSMFICSIPSLSLNLYTTKRLPTTCTGSQSNA